MPPRTENSSRPYHVVEYQSKPRGLWVEYFVWFDSKARAQSWIAAKTVLSSHMRYRIKKLDLLRNPHPAKEPDAQPTEE